MFPGQWSLGSCQVCPQSLKQPWSGGRGLHLCHPGLNLEKLMGLPCSPPPAFTHCWI